LFVVRTMPLDRLFRIFKQRRTHMAVVVNEYGKLAGLVTMEDLLEELFGEIRDERELQKSLASRIRLATEPGIASPSQEISTEPAPAEAPPTKEPA
jgi:Mg2+/Co2+ transporter CorC